MNRFFAFLGLTIACIAGFSILSFIVASTTTTGEIVMVQPNGWTTERDHTYSETNLNNAQANNYNAQANRTNAQAEQVQRQIDPPYFDGLKQGLSCGVLIVVSLIVFGLFFASRFVRQP